MKRRVLLTATVLAAGFAAASAPGEASAQPVPPRVRVNRPGAVPGTVRIPYTVPDGQGTSWMIYYGGYLQQQGNNPVFSQASQLVINGNTPQGQNNTARMDEKTGEVMFENLQIPNIPGVTVTRRVLVVKEENYVRYVDVFKNAGGADQQIPVQLTSNTNYGINGATLIDDPRRKGQTIAWVAQTQNPNGRCALEVYAGKGAKVVPQVNYQQGNNQVMANINLPVPAGKEVALMHLHGTVDTLDAGQQFVRDFKEAKVLQSLPVEVRKILVNFPAGNGFIGDREVLRGELTDVVETRGGDRYQGTLKEPGYRVSTFYGDIDLPPDRVVALLNVGEFRPRQLVVTTDGEVFGGKLAKDTVDLELSGGQLIKVPLTQVARVGYRKRAGEPEEWKFDKPCVLMRTGDRVGVRMPAADQKFEVATRYGALSLDPAKVASVVFQSDEHGVHDIYLADGSKFQGLVRADAFDMTLSGAGASGEAQRVKFPAAGVAKIQLVAAPPEVDRDATATLDLMNDDMLVGAIAGDVKLDTAFDTLALKAGEIRRITHARDAGLDVQVELWDKTTVSGQLQEPTLDCLLAGGVPVRVPVALLEEYSQPLPQPGGAIVEKIKAAVGRLNNPDDWKARDAAEAELVQMGAVVLPTLRQVRPQQSVEAQGRIDKVIDELTPKKKAPAAGNEMPMPLNKDG